jgi:DNA polymerase delta subunit 1
MVVQQGHPEPFVRNVFTLNTCAPIVGCQVLSFKEERELLEVSLVVVETLYKYC